ncbi:conserved hypothetical protein [Luminiphilus syltensis NOR5-1B]|uniref:peptidylprolyl isomerase n=1 Tax=Luminiphilus syltensis NOR5-1B TaxID=565045 RepID=B8KXP1_9GAMM|nr:peptidylprolyl isomerase [Luminiphilus syltensis]EED34533.1 conserved hypothetical protein [Luminiphilus syltensis NOR5-1B]
MTLVTSCIRQPLVHFLIMGAFLFVFYLAITDDEASEDGHRIVVDEPTLLRFLQYRSKSFDPNMAAQKLSALNMSKREQLLMQLVREEALYREAGRLGLHRDDYVIKQRMVQKVEYLARGFGEAEQLIDRNAVATYYVENISRYEEPSIATFAHVFVRGLDDNARQRIKGLQQALSREDIAFSSAMGRGDRFVYHANYVERSRDMIDSHFGERFGAKLFEMSPDQKRWQGPVASDHGYHLVMLFKRDPASVPSLDSIYPRVAEDARRVALDQQTEQALTDIVSNYEVTFEGLPWAETLAWQTSDSDAG